MTTPHLQSARNPIQRHHGFRSQSRRHLHLRPIRLAALPQFLLRPPAFAQFLLHQTFCFLFVCFLLLLAPMMLPHLATHPLQHLFLQLRSAQKPPRPPPLPFPPARPSPAVPPSLGRTVAVLPRQPCRFPSPPAPGPPAA